MNLFATINHWLHLTAAILWIGGVAFQVLIFAPLLKNRPLPASFLGAILNRFRMMVGPLFLVLIVTGGINFGVRRAGAEMPVAYVTALGVKVFLVATVASLHFFMGLTPYDPDAAAPNERTSRILPNFTFSQVTLIIGMAIIFIASMLRHFKVSLS